MTTAYSSIQYLVLMRGTIDDFPLAIHDDLDSAIIIANDATEADFRRLANIAGVDVSLAPVGVTVVKFINGFATAYVYHRSWEDEEDDGNPKGPTAEGNEYR